jgi:hypothetical protein
VIANIVAGLVTTALVAAAVLVWGYRGYLGLLHATLHPAGRLRVSVAALLRVKDDDCYVLFHHPYRPNVYGPPGGVVKYTTTARRTLDALGFIEQRSATHQATMSQDLRGFLPARRGISFLRWYAKGEHRESGTDCMRRELHEELIEAGHPELVSLTGNLNLEVVRNVFEGPRLAGARRYRTVRMFDVYDIVEDSPEAAELVRRLLALGRDEAETKIIAVSSVDIEEGRHGPYIIAPQSAFLLGTRRFSDDLPALR